MASVTLYSIHKNSERAYICSQGHNHGCKNHEVACPEEEVQSLLDEFSDTLDVLPWLNINNEWERSKPEQVKTKTKEQGDK